MLALQKERKVLHMTKPTTKDYQVSLFSLFYLVRLGYFSIAGTKSNLPSLINSLHARASPTDSSTFDLATTTAATPNPMARDSTHCHRRVQI